MENPDLGFTNYVRHRILHVDNRFRKDPVYFFFLLLVKEVVELERCKTTYLRQARMMPNLSKTEIQNIKHENLARHNRSFQVFKSLRGTSPYYEHSKKDLMACLRQRGCPTLFLTFACAEYKWNNLLKQIIEVNERRTIDLSDIDLMNSSEKNKLLSDNAVISTLHFQKRVEKLFNYFKNPEVFKPYFMKDYYLRVEFQARGAPHIHCLLWLHEEMFDDETKSLKDEPLKTMFSVEDGNEIQQESINKIEERAKNLICASISDNKCILCKQKKKFNPSKENCENENIEQT